MRRQWQHSFRVLLLLLSSLELVRWGYADDVLMTTPEERDALRFFVYEEPAFAPELCIAPREDGRVEPVSYLDVQSFVDDGLLDHPWRVRNESEAEIFVIRFNLERSFEAGTCNGKTHLNRLEEMLAALVKSPWYKRYDGADHFWVVLDWKFRYTAYSEYYPQRWRYFVQKMIIGRYIAYHSHLTLPRRYGGDGETLLTEHKAFKWLTRTQEWRCPVQLPIITPKGLLVDESFEQWQQRPIFMYFRGKERDCYDARNQKLRNGTKKLKGFPNSIFSNDHAETPEAYMKEISNAKFCLVFGCDDPQTSRFYDAVAAGCIPVLIDDAFRQTVSPFVTMLNYDAFTITVPESAWTDDPITASRIIYGWHQGRLKNLQAGLMAAKRYLTWEMPHNSIITMALGTIRRECLDWRDQNDF